LYKHLNRKSFETKQTITNFRAWQTTRPQKIIIATNIQEYSTFTKQDKDNYKTVSKVSLHVISQNVDK